MSFRVQKRNQELEDFNPGKIKHVVMASGMNEEEANKVCINVSKWAEDRVRPIVTTIQLRDRIIVEMQKINHDAAINFINYEKQRDKTTTPQH